LTGIHGPLSDLRILDLTHVWAGPLAVRMLSDLGAQVVKIEAPYGRGPQVYPSEPLGGWLGGEPGDKPWNNNALFVKLHRNRRSLCMDLKKQAGKALLLELVAEADAVIENYSATAMERMGLGYEVLRQTNQEIVYVTMPGFGASGPYSDRVAFGPVVEPMSGLTTMLGYSPEEPRNSAMALMDPVAATHAVAAVVTALRERQRTGRGSLVELSLHEGGVSYSGPWLLDQQLGLAPSCLGNRHPKMVPHGIYRCQGEDQWLALACEQDDQWQSLLALLEQDGAGAGMQSRWRLAERREQENQIDSAISSWTANNDKNQLTERLQENGIPAGPVSAAPEMVKDPQTQHRGFFVSYERFDTPMPGNPIHLSGLDSSEWTPCPGLGEHNSEVLADWLGYDDRKINELSNADVLLDRPPG
jgi:crotonobetainyl-CoA:carnitine CoA-transferase CaiB-like acyl-CoA transferase